MIRSFDEEFQHQVNKNLSETACAFCQEVIPDVEPCPLCGKRACVDHGSIVHFKRNGTHEEYLWACEDCEEILYKREDTLTLPIIEAWEKGQSVLGMLRPECPVHCGSFRVSLEREPDATQEPQAGEVL